jgi:hypothetical protein
MRAAHRVACLGLLAVAACQPPHGHPVPQASRAQPPAVTGVPEDSIRSLVMAYEQNSLSLDAATNQLADLIEPMNGFAVGPGGSPRSRELFESVRRELSRRDMKRYGIADSVP